MDNTCFLKHLESKDPEVRRKANAWLTAVNDRIFSGEMVSPWFLRLAEQHILGNISLEEFDKELGAHWDELDYILENGFTDPS